MRTRTNGFGVRCGCAVLLAVLLSGCREQQSTPAKDTGDAAAPTRKQQPPRGQQGQRPKKSQRPRPRPMSMPPADQPTIRADETWPNVLLISIDSLRPDHLHCYGYERQTSPRIDQLAAEGALFRNVVSSTSWTLPAHAAMFTGLADSVHGCTDADRRLADDRHTLAERLRDVGYKTVGLFSGPFLHPVFGLAQGFDTYIDCSSYPDMADETAAETDSMESDPVWEAAYRDITSPRIVREVRGWLEQHDRPPVFMFVHMWDVHFDFVPPAPYDTMFDPGYTGAITGQNFFVDPRINKDLPKRDLEHIVALYDGEIAWTDQHVGEILDAFAERGLLENTLVIVTSDHGTAFFEHGLKGHRNSLYDETILIPLIVRLPGLAVKGRVVEEQVRLVDIVPTVLDVVGLPEARPMVMGQSLTPAIDGGALAHDVPAVAELASMTHDLLAVRRVERKTIHDIKHNRTNVYDLKNDPGEHAPIARRRDPVVVAAHDDFRWVVKFLKTFRQRFPVPATTVDVPVPVHERLITLGYVETQPASAPATQPATSPASPPAPTRPDDAEDE